MFRVWRHSSVEKKAKYNRHTPTLTNLDNFAWVYCGRVIQMKYPAANYKDVVSWRWKGGGKATLIQISPKPASEVKKSFRGAFERNIISHRRTDACWDHSSKISVISLPQTVSERPPAQR